MAHKTSNSRPDWKQAHANNADRVLKHQIVKDVLDEYVGNMRGFGVDLDRGLPSYGIHKVMHYVAQVAMAQALGFDPELLHMSDAEATEAQLKLARLFADAGKPVYVITDESEMLRG